MKKNIIILESAPGARLTNQLWNFISIYAYCLEKGFVCKNYSFFEQKRQPDGSYSRIDYNQFFDLPRRNFFNRLLIGCQVNYNKLCQKLRPYNRYVAFIKRTKINQVLYSDSDKHTPFYLPPSGNQNPAQRAALEKMKKSAAKNIYFSGWLFRNPAGLKKYQVEIQTYFKPKKKILAAVESFIAPLKKNYEHIVGVHVRQTDYKTYEKGRYFLAQDKIRKIMEQYISFYQKDPVKTLFLICSDDIIDKTVFSGLNIATGPGGAAEDLFALSQSNFIIGSNSTFGAFAAYYGNIPFAVFNEINMNFEKINPNGGFNYNNDCTVIHQ